MGQIGIGASIMTVFTVIPFVLMRFLMKNRNELDDKDFKKRYGSFYPGVHLKRYKYTVCYFPIFLLRKLLYILIPTVIVLGA